MLIFGIMPNKVSTTVIVTHHLITSVFLQRNVVVNFYLPDNITSLSQTSLLLINDGQDLPNMPFNKLLEKLYHQNEIAPLLCVGIHCGIDRKNEYATAKIPDYLGRGSKAAAYTQFIFEELLPFLYMHYSVDAFKEISFAGFSLGGLSALDIVWNNATTFSKAGVFSGSLWWRDKDQSDPNFDEWQHRIMHRQIREGNYAPWLQFFFEAGAKDETADRNNNGIIDAIDDTLDLLNELKKKGYPTENITYVELEEGRHDVTTWAVALPIFLKWGWGKAYKL